MGEQPLWTTRAQIFEIDQATKTSWVPCTKQTVSVSFYHDPNRQTYRIISVDGSKAILNSTITSNMVFTKTAQKFGQWSDPKAGTIYGVGFPSEEDLKQFADIFKEALETKQERKNSASQPLSPSHSAVSSTSNLVQNGSTKSTERSSSINSGGSSGSTNQEESPLALISPSMDTQLKYENDKLKLALAQSSANAKKWETELQNLRNNNARLTTALQESTSNVEEWKKQLLLYKDDNLRLRTRVQELGFLQQESGESAGNVVQLQSEKNSLDQKVVLLESSLEQQSKEIASLILQLNELQNLKLSNSELADKVRELKLENTQLQSVKSEFSTKERTMVEQEGKLTELRELLNKLDTQYEEMINVREQIREKLRS